jgi:hypothetical protein
MGRATTDTEDRSRTYEPPKKPRQRFTLAMRPFLLAAIPVGLTVYYFAWVAPSLVPVDPGVKVPFPPATRLFEDLVVWCEEHSRAVLLAGVGVLLPGFFYRSVDKAERYYLRLAIVVSVLLGIAYLSVSAPIDRFMHSVEENVPQDRRVPDHSGTGER